MPGTSFRASATLAASSTSSHVCRGQRCHDMCSARGDVGHRCHRHVHQRIPRDTPKPTHRHTAPATHLHTVAELIAARIVFEIAPRLPITVRTLVLSCELCPAPAPVVHLYPAPLHRPSPLRLLASGLPLPGRPQPLLPLQCAHSRAGTPTSASKHARAQSQSRRLLQLLLCRRILLWGILVRAILVLILVPVVACCSSRLSPLTRLGHLSASHSGSSGHAGATAAAAPSPMVVCGCE